MIMCILGAGILVLLGGLTVAAPGYAVAGPPVPKWEDVPYEAVLYETTENTTIRALRGGRRKATSELLGFAARGSALCPEALVRDLVPEVRHCVLNATASDNISLKTGLGLFRGTVTVVVQEINKVTGNPTPDSPEIVIATGRFTGHMNFSPAILYQIPLGSVEGHLSLEGFSKRVPFTGVFRLPFVFPPVAGDTPLYLLNPPSPLPVDMSTWQLLPLALNETAIGYPTVRFEISF